MGRSVKQDLKAVIFPSIGLGAKVHGDSRCAIAPLQRRNVLGKHPVGRETAAGEITGRQCFVFSPQKSFQSGDLAGSRAEQHLPLSFQEAFRLLK